MYCLIVEGFAGFKNLLKFYLKLIKLAAKHWLKTIFLQLSVRQHHGINK